MTGNDNAAGTPLITNVEVTGGSHLYLRQNDSLTSVRRYARELHVCEALEPEGGIHLAVRLDRFGPPPGADGHEKQRAAGLNLTTEQGWHLLRHLQTILGAEAGGDSE